MKTCVVVALTALASVQESTAWSSSSSSSQPQPPLSRREAFQKAALTSAAATATVLLPNFPAFADVTEETPRIVTRMGGLLEPYQDSRGIRLMAPSGWNKFDGEVGAYDLKWQDLVDPTENIKITSTPVKSTTESVALLGPVEEVGKSLAAKRNAKLVAAEERQTDGILFYKFDFAINDGTHQLLQLCVSKGKLWSVDANAKEKRWSKREELCECYISDLTLLFL